MNHFEVASDMNVDSGIPPARRVPGRVPNTVTVLEELFVLLEEYGPVWYTKEHHDRAIRALLGRDE